MDRNSKLYERRRLRKLEAYHKGFLDALARCQAEFGYSEDFFDPLSEKHSDKIADIQKKIKGLPPDDEE